ncbi:MAG: IS607 family transposase [Thermoplasmata archaeon]|nr:IS607 family transposase [Candidatus Sysuiplasma jiujiangense]
MKLSVWARKEGIGYRAAWRMWKAGQLKAHQLPTGTIIVEEERPSILPDSVAIYARVSSSEKRGNLDSQAERLTQYAIARGYRIYRVVKEVGSGVNDSRKQLLKLLTDDGYSKIVVDHRDRLTRFGFNYIDTLLRQHGKCIEVVNEASNDRDDLMQDFVSIITSFCARLYGLRPSRRKTEKIIAELKHNGNDA